MNPSPCIRNLIFDFGGVIIDIDFNKTIAAFKALGAKDFDRQYGKASQSGLFDRMDKGELDGNAFAEELLNLLPAGTSPEQVFWAWNQMILGVPPKRVELLRSLRPRYQTLLLSNTNRLHYELYMPEMRKLYGISNFEDLFDHVFLSFRLGMRKPEREIFERVFRVAGIRKEETLFIDDSLHIIEAARSYDIPSCWLQDGTDICDLFKNGKLRDEVTRES